MLPYFPFGPRYNEKMGTSPLGEADRLVETTAYYEAEISLKRALLAELPDYYFAALPGHETAQWEVLDVVLTHLAKREPVHFSLKKRGEFWHWKNYRLGEETRFVLGKLSTLPQAPLDWAGRQTQEDLLLLQDGVLVAGQLCFANDWCLADKLGLPFLAIHAPVGPVIAPMLAAAQTLLDRLPAARPVSRANWSFKLSDTLDQSTRRAEALELHAAQVRANLPPGLLGGQVWVRVERQTLSRLPRSGAVLFTVHTFQNALAAEAADPTHAAAMLGVLRSTPSELLDYKGITPFLEPLLQYLARAAGE